MVTDYIGDDKPDMPMFSEQDIDEIIRVLTGDEPPHPGRLAAVRD